MSTTTSSNNNDHHLLHGLAAKIRSATESETFDLGGLPSTTIEQIVKDAFEKDWDPLPQVESGIDKMIRITLIVGGGKQSRQKYDPNATKIVTSALQSTCCHYQEDRAASNVAECAGLYKLQHDTGKNLKTVIIFPRFRRQEVEEHGSTKSSAITTTTGTVAAASLHYPSDSMEYKVMVCSMTVFHNILKHKVPSWTQKRNLLQWIEDDILHRLQECEQVLLQQHGNNQLSSSQQEFYDACVDMDAKHGAVKEAMHQQYEDEQLTPNEREILLDQVSKRIQELTQTTTTEISAKAATTAALLTKAKERQTKLQSMTPIPLPPLKHHVALTKLWKQAAPLLPLQAKSASQQHQQLTLQETKKLGQLNDLLEQIEMLECDSQGWLEDDEIFQARIEQYRRNIPAATSTSTLKSNQSIPFPKGTAKGSAKSSIMTTAANKKSKIPSTTTNAWMSAKDPKEKQAYVQQKTKQNNMTMMMKKRDKKNNKNDVFLRMLMDSDSSASNNDDGDDDNDNEEDLVDNKNPNSQKSKFQSTTTTSTERSIIIDTPPPTATTNQSSPNNNSNNNTTKKKKNKKKKKTITNTNQEEKDDDEDEAILNAAISANQKEAITETKTATTKGQPKEDLKSGGDVGDGDKNDKSSNTVTLGMAVISYVMRQYVLPIILAILTWLVSMVMGSSGGDKTKRKKKRNA